MKVFSVLYKGKKGPALLGTFLNLDQAKRYCQETVWPSHIIGAETRWVSEQKEAGMIYSLFFSGKDYYLNSYAGYDVVESELQE